MNRETHNMLTRLERIGISADDALSLRRISMTLHRWHELECGDGNDYASWSVERDETTGKPYPLTYYHNGVTRRHRIADKEAGARRRLNAIMAKYPELSAYVQTDPRGASLYIYRADDSSVAESGIESCYSSIGIAVYK